MKLIEYDKYRIRIQKKVTEIMFNFKITIRESIDKIMELLDNLPADYTEEQITGIDQAYQRICQELEAVQRGAKEQRAVAYAALHRMITGRIVEIQSLLLQYPEAAAGMSGRLDELNMMLAECEKMAAETNCKKRMLDANNREWIACSERMPESDITVLVQVSGKYKNITFVNAFEFASHTKEDGWILDAYPDWNNPVVIAWQYLPEQYLERRL